MMPFLCIPPIMRGEILAGISSLNGVKCAVIIGPDALSIEYSPTDIDAEKFVANWHALESIAPENATKIFIRTSDSFLFSQRIDEGHTLLIQTDIECNVGSMRSIIAKEIPKLVPFL